MGAAKEEWSGGTVDWPQKIQTTNLVGPFEIFILCSEISPNLKGT